MLRERIGHSAMGHVVTVPRETSVLDVACRMLRHGNGAVLVIDDGALAGIFTERDAVFRVMAAGLDPSLVPVGDVMTCQPVTIDPQATLGQAMLVMLDHGFRRLPVLEDGRVVGLVTARNGLDPDLEDFVSEERRRESLR
jgi:CBS domain-containing protein